MSLANDGGDLLGNRIRETASGDKTVEFEGLGHAAVTTCLEAISDRMCSIFRFSSNASVVA